MARATGWLRFVCSTATCSGRTWAICDVDVDGDERVARVLGGKPRCERCGARMLPDWTSGPRGALPEEALDELVDDRDVVEIPGDVELDF